MTQLTAAPAGLRARHTDETRAALVAAARRLFAQKGYHHVGIREFAAEAGVTRGALYHHFAGKEDLLLAVIDSIKSELQSAAARRHRKPDRPDRWLQLRQDLQIGLDDMMQPDILKILLLDAPSVLGWQRWRAESNRFGLAAITKAVERSIAEGLIAPLPATTLAQLISASYNEASLTIAFADDPAAARASAGAALDALLAGLAIDKG
ncbi:MAG: TetR/AcrR family transcriptional regulator [Sphingobium sp.]